MAGPAAQERTGGVQTGSLRPGRFEMSRPVRILRNAAIALGALIVLLGMAGVLVLRSAWFQNYVKQTIITSTEDSTGGRAEIASFNFEWTHLAAVMTGCVIHGTEPAGTAPMLRVARVQLNFRLLTSLHHLWDITYLGIDHPEANVMVYPDGHTNIPSPRTKSTSSSPLETVVDLAIGRLELSNGLITVAAQKHELNVRANNLRAQLSYNIFSQEYSGQVSLQPVYVASGRNIPVDLTVNLPLVLSRHRIDVHDASIASSASAITLNASLEDLKNPKISVHASGHIALADLSMKAVKSLPVMDLDATASAINNAIEVTRLRLSLGRSSIDASGSLSQGLNFESRLALGELGRLANIAAPPDTAVNVSGTATLDAQNNYKLRGDLKNLNLASAIRVPGQPLLPYDGVLSGPINIAGNLNTGLRGLTAQAKLSIAAGSRGIPLSGKLTANYSGTRDDVAIQNSLLTLPHSRLSVDG